MSRYGHSCHDCIHDGCCDGLPHCGGSSWSPAYGGCAQCGGTVRLDDVDWETEDGEHVFCSEECINAWLAENGEEEDAEDGD